jgi:hypothetical protein
MSLLSLLSRLPLHKGFSCDINCDNKKCLMSFVILLSLASGSAKGKNFFLTLPLIRRAHSVRKRWNFLTLSDTP